MIDQHTPVEVQVAGAMPRKVDAVVLFAVAGAGDSSVGGVVYAGNAQLDDAGQAALQLLRAGKGVSGKRNEITQQAIAGGGRLIVVGLGKASGLKLQAFRDAAGTVARLLRQQQIVRVAVVIDPELPPPSHEIAEAVATGLCTGFFKLTAFKGVTAEKHDAKARLEATLVVTAPAARFAATVVARAVTIAGAQNFSRAVAGHPGNVMHPPALTTLCQRVAKSCGLTCRVLDERQMARLGMGGMLAVGMGSSATPPRMIVLEWTGRTKRPAAAPLLLVGKAITFDTGGVSIKPREGMQRMVFDKCGAMAVLGAMIAVSRLKLPVRVVGILAAAENHVSATAYRPGDILKMYNGVTVEVTNTDAEGRLVLADALAWGIEQFRPAAVVDLATLTGGVVVALGHEYAGVMGTNDALADELKRSGDVVGEKIWPLPLGDEVRDMLKSDHADIVNSAGRYAHALQGGEFLRRFVVSSNGDSDTGAPPWAHLDIAGVADSEKGSAMYAPGATGWGVRTLVQWISARAGAASSRPG